MCNEIKKRGIRIAVLLTAALFFYPLYVGAAGPARPDDRSGRKVVTLPADEVVNEDYFAWGDVVEILGTVHGDVYAAGGEIHVNGTIDGDLLAAGGRIDLKGKVGQDARLLGGEVTVAGVVGKNLTIAAGQITLTDTAAVLGNVISAGEVTVAGRIRGALKALAGDLHLRPTANIGGDVTYRSPHPAQIEAGAKIGGMVMQRTPHGMFDFSPGQMIGTMVDLFLLFKVISFVSTLILGLLLIFLFPGFSRAVVSTLREQPMASLGWGVLWLIVTPFVLLALVVTLVGIPLALILFPLYFISLYLARIAIILWAGTALLERMGKGGHPGWGLLIGLVLYSVLTLIPGPGGLISLFVILFGLGASLLTLRAKYSAA